MVNIFDAVDRFFISLKSFDINYNVCFILFISLFLFTILCVIIITAKSYESKLTKAVDMFNSYFLQSPNITEENLVSFNNRMKSNKVPKQLRKQWQQYVLYREAKASEYMSFENCVTNQTENSSFKRAISIMNILSYIFATCALLLGCYVSYENNVAVVLQKVFLTPAIILLLNFIVTIFLNLRHNAVVTDLYQNYQYFEVNIDKATQTLPEYVDYEVLFDRAEIKKGIPILYSYLQKRAEEEKRELELARLKNVEHERFNFDEAGVAGSLVLERAMQEAENYIAERKKYNQDTEQINSDITQEESSFREITKEYNRQMQVSKETFANFKSQLEGVTSTIEANYLKKQQQQELDRQRNLERDFDTAAERHKTILEGFQRELDGVDKYRAESRKVLEEAMMSEFETYSSKVYDEAKKIIEERQKEKFEKIKNKIIELEEKLVSKEQELTKVYEENHALSEQLESAGIAFEGVQKPVEESEFNTIEKVAESSKPVQKAKKENMPEYEQVNETFEQPAQNTESFEPSYTHPSYQADVSQGVKYDLSNLGFGQTQEEERFEEEFEEEPSQPIEEPVNEEPINEETISEEESGENSSEEGKENLSVIDRMIQRDNNSEETPETEENFESDEEFEEDGNEEPVSENQSEDIDALDENSQENNLEEDGNLEDDESDEEDDEDGGLEYDLDAFDRLFGTSPKQDIEEKESENEEKEEELEEEKAEEIAPTNYSTIKNESEESGVTKRKVGRPRKEVVEQPVTIKKQRGRPRKVEQDAVVKETKQRGRPRKEDVKSVAVKQGRGRPKKQNITIAVKQGRGRPRKEDAVSAPVKHGRGRPKKIAQLQRSVGRPRLNDEFVKAKPKSGRGRPKKLQANDYSYEIATRNIMPKKISKTSFKNLEDIDAYLREIDDVIAQENAKFEASKKVLEQKARNIKKRR